MIENKDLIAKILKDKIQNSKIQLKNGELLF